jgi:predicted DsbA family dithiol-disulfide isomerase
MSSELTVYYDYLCPYNYRMAFFLEGIKKESGVIIDWKAFSLEQQNSNKGPEFRIWEHPDLPSYGLLALAASKAAKNQGEDLFVKFHLSVFEARHKDRIDISDHEELFEIAGKSGLDLTLFEEDIMKSETFMAVGKDHEEARTCYNVFGVPTLVFEGNKAAYVKLESIPKSKEEQISLFELLSEITADRPYLLEIKRPEKHLL